jgi:hypothetical protein
MKTIGIIGSRRRDSDSDFVECRKVFLSVYEKGDTLVSGGCPRGGDRYAEILAKEYNVPIKIHKAEWDKYGKSAGFKRNVYIAQDADVVIAVCAEDRTGGTENTIFLAQKLGKKIIIVPLPEFS